MSKDLSVSRLCDVYGSLLTEHKRAIVREYYDDDLSLTEIAENHGITRQAALCSIKQAEKQLRDYESKLGFLAKTDILTRELDELSKSVDGDISSLREKVDKILSEL